MRFKKIWRGNWWQLGELCEIPRWLLWRDWGVIVLCTMFLVSSSINVSIFHSTWLDPFWTDLVPAIHDFSDKHLHLQTCRGLADNKIILFPEPGETGGGKKSTDDTNQFVDNLQSGGVQSWVKLPLVFPTTKACQCQPPPRCEKSWPGPCARGFIYFI